MRSFTPSGVFLSLFCTSGLPHPLICPPIRPRALHQPADTEPAPERSLSSVSVRMRAPVSPPACLPSESSPFLASFLFSVFLIYTSSTPLAAVLISLAQPHSFHSPEKRYSILLSLCIIPAGCVHVCVRVCAQPFGSTSVFL